MRIRGAYTFWGQSWCVFLVPGFGCRGSFEDHQEIKDFCVWWRERKFEM